MVSKEICSVDRFVKMLSINDVSEINRVLGILEGLSYSIQDPGVADGILNVIERIEAVVNKEEQDGN